MKDFLVCFQFHCSRNVIGQNDILKMLYGRNALIRNRLKLGFSFKAQSG